MKKLLFAVMLNAISTWATAATPEEELAKSKNCLGCHAMSKKVMGPALLDIAKKYGGQPDAEAMLVQKILTGSKGVWGAMAMPPNPVSVADATTLVKWILEQK